MLIKLSRFCLAPLSAAALAAILLPATALAQLSYGGSFSAYPGPDEGATSALILASDGGLYGSSDLAIYCYSYPYDYSFLSQPVTALAHASSGPARPSTSDLIPDLFTGCQSGLTPLHTVTGGTDLGRYSSLIQGPDSALYGVSPVGGANGSGQVFRLALDGTFSTLYSFCSLADCADGVAPTYPLITGSDGNFYGVTSFSPASNSSKVDSWGTVFRLTPAGVLTTLHTFCPSCAAGYGPSSPLIQASDGNFYGTDGTGAQYAASTIPPSIYQITAAGVTTLVHALCNTLDCIQIGSLNSGLIEGTDHALYGYQSSDYDPPATAYRVTTAGTFTTLFSFCTSVEDSGCSTAPLFSSPTGPIFLAGDGNLYGTAQFSGGGGYGNVYSFTPQIVANFEPGTDGATPTNGVTQNQYGNLIGYAENGGEGYGGIYSLFFNQPDIPPAIQISPATANILTTQSTKISWNVANAASLTMQQCIGRVNNQSFGSVSTKGSYTLPPSAAGYYVVAITCGGIESAYSDVTVTATPTATTTSLQNVSLDGSNFGLFANVFKQNAFGDVTGTASLLINSNVIGTYSLSHGMVGLYGSLTGLLSGNYLLAVHYNGDAGDSPSVSPPVAASVSGTTVALLSNIYLGRSSTGAQTGRLDYSITNTAPIPMPTGSVTFSYHGSPLATVTLANGTAQITQPLTGLPAGTYPITAKYSGDPNNPAFSTTLNITIP